MNEEYWVTALQPTMFPSIHLMQRIAMCDAFVTMNEAQYDKTHMRATLMTKNGPVKLVAPCSKPRRAPFLEIDINPEDWVQKTVKTLQFVYGKCEGWKDKKLRVEVIDLVGRTAFSKNAADLGWNSISGLLKILNLGTFMYGSGSVVSIRPQDPSVWIASFCKALDATHYVQGKESMDAYMRREAFPPALKLMYQDWKVPAYPQLGGQEFNSSVSILDALLILGREQTRVMLASSGKAAKEWL